MQHHTIQFPRAGDTVHLDYAPGMPDTSRSYKVQGCGFVPDGAGHHTVPVVWLEGEDDPVSIFGISPADGDTTRRRPDPIPMKPLDVVHEGLFIPGSPHRKTLPVTLIFLLLVAAAVGAAIALIATASTTT